MPTKASTITTLMVTAVAALAFGAPAAPKPRPAEVTDARTTLEAAADALGMLRTAGLGGGRNPRLDVINTMEFWASGTPFSEYHAALVYDPPGMRVELTNPNGNPQHLIEVVDGKYAWNASEIGAGLEAGRGTVTPEMAAANERLLRLWIMPYGVVKAGLAAGDKAKVSTEDGATIVTFPLMGQLAGVTVKVTLDDKSLVSKVETKGPANLTTETEYSDYKDRGEIPTDVQFPGHIVRKRDGKTVVDLQVKMADGNNPYVVIPVPDDVKKLTAK